MASRERASVCLRVKFIPVAGSRSEILDYAAT